MMGVHEVDLPPIYSITTFDVIDWALEYQLSSLFPNLPCAPIDSGYELIHRYWFNDGSGSGAGLGCGDSDAFGNGSVFADTGAGAGGRLKYGDGGYDGYGNGAKFGYTDGSGYGLELVDLHCYQ